MFDIFVGKVRNFKERFFLVKLRSETTLNIILEVAKGEGQVRRPLFPLCWNKDNFGFEPKDFCLSIPSLTE